jgi:hypothetical protein
LLERQVQAKAVAPVATTPTHIAVATVRQVVQRTRLAVLVKLGKEATSTIPVVRLARQEELVELAPQAEPGLRDLWALQAQRGRWARSARKGTP